MGWICCKIYKNRARVTGVTCFLCVQINSRRGSQSAVALQGELSRVNPCVCVVVFNLRRCAWIGWRPAWSCSQDWETVLFEWPMLPAAVMLQCPQCFQQMARKLWWGIFKVNPICLVAINLWLFCSQMNNEISGRPTADDRLEDETDTEPQEVSCYLLSNLKKVCLLFS